MRWLVFVVLAGCYSPSGYTSCLVTCAEARDCPTGQSCFAGRCSERENQCMIDASTADTLDPKGDIDDDGILNDVDKCPTVKSVGNRDHDGDGTGDECDGCPHLKGPTGDIDGDGDGVGNACDRNPSTAGEKKLAFYGFYDANEIAGWIKQGDFTVAAEHLVADNRALGGGYIERPGSLPTNLHLMTNVVITATGGALTNDRHVGISTRRNAAGHFHACHLHQEDDVNYVRHLIYNGTQSPALSTYGGNFVDPHRIQMIQEGVTTCHVDNQMLPRTVVGTTGPIGLDASFVRAELDYLFIVELPSR